MQRDSVRKFPRGYSSQYPTDSMKVYVHYEEGNDTEQHTTLKLTLPRKWNDESPVKLLQVRL